MLPRVARGIDQRRVKADRPRKSLGAERTLDKDISSGPALREVLVRLVGLTLSILKGEGEDDEAEARPRIAQAVRQLALF